MRGPCEDRVAACHNTGSVRSEREMATNAETPAIALGSLKPRGTRRLVFNSDPSNTMALLSDPARPDELRRIVRLYVEEGDIDTLIQEVFSQAMTHFWRTDTCSYDIRPPHQRLVPMMDDGLMPVEVLIDECHKRGMEFLAGWRMNDRHGHHVSFFRKLSKEKPQWILHWKPASSTAHAESRKYGCALNFAVREVRDWYLAIMVDMAHRFDIDGFELNFTRLPECFPADEAAESHGIMTGFVREVREMLDGAGRNGRLILGVRVLQQMDACRTFGFDVPTWMAEGIIDYVAPSDWQFTDFNERYEDFVSPARAHDCCVYPQITTRIGFRLDVESSGDMDPLRYRAAARNFYGAGADGVSPLQFAFHWGGDRLDPLALNCLEGADGPETVALNYLRDLKNPETVAAGDRHYVFVPLWREDIKTYKKEAIVLSRREVHKRGTFRCRLCEDFPADPILPLTDEGSGLRFFPTGLLEGDEIAIDINGTAIPPEHVRWQRHDDGRPSSCTIVLSSPPFVYGDNHLGLTLTTPAEEGEGEITVERVECMVRAQAD